MSDAETSDSRRPEANNFRYPGPPSDYESDGASSGGEALHLSRYTTNVPIMNPQPQGPPYQPPLNGTNLEHSEGVLSGEQRDGVAPLGRSLPQKDGLAGYTSPSSTVSSPYTNQSLASGASSTPPTEYGWNGTRIRSNSNSNVASLDGQVSGVGPSAPPSARPERPQYSRTPSSAYAPPRRPSQFQISTHSSHSFKHRSSSTKPHKSNPEADYRAQKKAYEQLANKRQNSDQDVLANTDGYPPGLGYSSGTDTDGESPSVPDYVESDPYDQETLLYYNNEDNSPSAEELKIPANRERLEWHSMLANVLTGDVVRQEKKRITGATDAAADKALAGEIWIGVRAKVCGRSLPAQKKLLEDERNKIAGWIEEIISFEIRSESEVGKSAKQQVEDVVKLIEKCERLYPTQRAFAAAHPRADSETFRESSDALIAWHNTTALINTELEVLQAWVGNEELDLHKRLECNSGENGLQDDAPFIDRVLKEDGLKPLQGDRKQREDGIRTQPEERPMILYALNAVIDKAKKTLVENAEIFFRKHLPPYIEELLTLINFPSRLLQEIVCVRLSYANKIKDPQKQNVMMAEQTISQFQILLTLAVKIKTDYLGQSTSEPGWDLPPCLDENLDETVLSALKFYFKLLGWKLFSNRNSFKEAEILEQEWDFANVIGRHFPGGDVEVAEQFSSLTSKSLFRLTTYFEQELKRRPNEVAGPEMDRRYKSMLDSVRVRQRKLFRFTRLLTQAFENATEFSISMPQHHLENIYENLLLTHHFMISPASQAEDRVFIFASPSLAHRPHIAESLLGTCYRADEEQDDPSNPYVVVLNPEVPVVWEGPTQEIDRTLPHFGTKPGKLRVVAEGSGNVLSNARLSFLQAIGTDLDTVISQKANLPRVDQKLAQIKKTAYKLSNTIMDSVEIIRKQLVGLECQELIQNCFAFATEFGQRSLQYMDNNRKQLNNIKLTRLALDWVAFICDDCVASDRKTFRWAVVALEFAMIMTRGQNILSINDEEYAKLRSKVAGCMSLLISHFDIMGARSTVAANAESKRAIEATGGRFRLDTSKMKDDEESARAVSDRTMDRLSAIDSIRKEKEAERQALGHVLENSNDADRSLTFLSSSATNVTLRWQQGQFIGGGTFGAVYIGHNLDSGQLMAVKEIRLQDPQLIPKIAQQIREEMGVLQILEHPNMVKYHGIEVHRDKVFIFMDYCAGGSLAGLLEHGRIDDESFILVYTLQMLEGLAYLHESGVIHRDIKPENILLDHNGIIKFVDFGAARVIAQHTAGGRTIAGNGGPGMNIGAPEQPPGAVAGRQGKQRSMTGTPMYMSPEMINPDSLNGGTSSSTSPTNGTSNQKPTRPGAVDIWSLGCVVLEMATGRRPWASLDNEWAIMYNIAQGNPPQLPSKEQLSEQGLEFLKRCFERDPARRATAAELLQCEWIMGLRNQLQLEGSGGGGGRGSGGDVTPQTPQTPTPGSEGSGSGSGSQPVSAVGSRHNTRVWERVEEGDETGA